MTIAGAPMVVALIGLILWFVFSLPVKPPATPHPMRAWFAELGKIIFFVGLLVLVATLNTTAWRLTLG